MPEKPKISDKHRNAEDTYRHSFISCDVKEFERRLQLKKFIQMMQENEPRMNWDFGDRVYIEKHRRNTLQ